MSQTSTSNSLGGCREHKVTTHLWLYSSRFPRAAEDLRVTFLKKTERIKCALVWKKTWSTQIALLNIYGYWRKRKDVKKIIKIYTSESCTITNLNAIKLWKLNRFEKGKRVWLSTFVKPLILYTRANKNKVYFIDCSFIVY